MIFRFGGTFAALWLAACAGMPADSAVSSSQGAAPASGEMVCSTEQATGTHLSRGVCRNKEDIARERAAAEREMQRMQRVQNPVGGN